MTAARLALAFAGVGLVLLALPSAAHAWTLLHDTEEDAFRSQIEALGTGTTLLVDTYDTRRGVELAIQVAGTGLGGVRIDSGDLPTVAAEVREQLDDLGATATKITVTSDLDEYAIAALAASPVDAYGVGTSVVTGSGTPTAGMVYKLVARQADDGSWVAVAKASTDKGSKGGRKAAFRTLERGKATRELIAVSDGFEAVDTPEEHADGRPLQVVLVSNGEADAAYLGSAGVEAARVPDRGRQFAPRVGDPEAHVGDRAERVGRASDQREEGGDAQQRVVARGRGLPELALGGGELLDRAIELAVQQG